MVIDWQHHYCPPEILTMRGKEMLPAGTAIYNDKGQVASHFMPGLYDIDAQLRFMDAAGIDMAVISMAGGVTFDESRVINDAFAKVMKDYPDRFVCLASCLPSRGEKSIAELDRAVLGLGLKGVSIDYQTDGHDLDSDALLPFYGRIAALKVPLFVHIAGTRQGFEGLMSTKYNLWTTLGTMVVDQSATVRMILSGVLSTFPDLRLVIAHLGGGIAAIRERFSLYLRIWGEKIWTEIGSKPPFEPPYERSFEKQLNKIYFDMAGYEGGMNAVKCALLSVSPDKLIFGTDYPYNFIDNPAGVKEYAENVKTLGLSPDAVEGMLGKNAARLLGM
jgi:aminocarboxymuconate-semialdehyde decarboxylase